MIPATANTTPGGNQGQGKMRRVAQYVLAAEGRPMSDDALLPDYDQANRFFTALTGSTDEPITFQFFDDKDKKNKRKATHRHMKRSSAYAFLHKKQKEGCGVYVMVNAGDGKGRSTKNVVKVRALFIDLDGAPWEEVHKMLPPHLRIESSPGRWHLYWLVNDCDLWQFKAIQQAIARRFDGDKSCCDLPRVLRVPGFYHLKKQPVMSRLAEVNNFPRYTTQQVTDGLLGIDWEPATTKAPPSKPQEAKTDPAPVSRMAYAYTDTKTGEVVDLMAWAAQNPAFDIVAAVNPKYKLGQVVDGKQHIVCPFADEHTDTGADLATFVVNADSGHPSFKIHCCHDHCADRDRLEFLQAMLEKGWLEAGKLIPAALPYKRVQKIFYPAGEIAAALQLRALAADEFRILLHLMHLAWSAEDGTLPDDDWMIARSLGLGEPSWTKYKMTLKRAGWLDVADGRLVNEIFRREFSNAQNALDSFRTRGQRGGQKSRT